MDTGYIDPKIVECWVRAFVNSGLEEVGAYVVVGGL